MIARLRFFPSPLATRWLPLAAAALLGGCITLGPDYERPDVDLPEGYSEAAATAPQAVPDEWWKLFGDPILDALVGEALAANQDLAVAAARVDEARAIAGIARADQLPQVNAGASGSRDKFSEKTAQLPPGFPLEFDTYRATVSLAYELDFWGRYRRLSEAARAELLASIEGQRNVRLAVVSETVLAYFDLRGLDQQLAIAGATLDSRSESVRLQRARFDAGTISELDLAQAEGELAATEAAVPFRQRVLRQTENRLAVLLGRIGGTVDRGAVPADEALGRIELPEVPPGLPSELLARRPDVAQAEQFLVAANARIGAARSLYFPSIALTGYAGSESDELSELFSSGTSIWGFAAGLLQPIFQGGRIRRGVEISEARQHQALAEYVKSVQEAFADVENALVARSTGIAEREAIERQVGALSRARHLADLRYEAGESSYIDLLDAERGLFDAELAWVIARRAELGSAVLLFRAIGGGWPASPPADTSASPSGDASVSPTGDAPLL
jgi:multidrug efflux system outer membrane protein